MTPAEELRAAAARLRCEHTHSVLLPHSLWAPGPCEKCGTPYDAPVDVPEPLREPLAGWLEEAARQADMNTCRAPRHRRDITHALAAARFILGGDR